MFFFFKKTVYVFERMIKNPFHPSLFTGLLMFKVGQANRVFHHKFRTFDIEQLH